MFKSLRVHPPGGWRFYQPEFEWPKNPTELRGIGIDAVVEKIYDKRVANKARWPNLSLDRSVIQREVIAFTEPIVRKMKGGEAYLVEGEAPQPPSASFQVARSFRKVAEVAGTVKRMAAGVGLIVDWLGDGMEAVPMAVAESRAFICAKSGHDKDGNPTVCPFNAPAHGLQKVSGVAAKDILLLMEARTEMKLATTYDAQLETCQICDCDLKLKVAAPAEHLKQKTPADVLARFKSEWPVCWMNTI